MYINTISPTTFTYSNKTQLYNITIYGDNFPESCIVNYQIADSPNTNTTYIIETSNVPSIIGIINTSFSISGLNVSGIYNCYLNVSDSNGDLSNTLAFSVVVN